MIERLAGGTRKFLVKCRCRAMQDGASVALNLLGGALAVNDPSRQADRIALTLLKAEILYLDCRHQESLDLIDQTIETASPDTPHDLLFVLRNNRSEVGLEVFNQESWSDFYRLADEQDLAGFQLFNALEIVSGEEAAAAGRHYDALPVFWRELVRTYQLGCWRPFRWAAKRLAQECLAIGELADAAYYVILARDDKIAEAVGQRLIAQRAPQVLGRTIAKCLTSANLLRHFEVACEILRQVGDAIPDEQLDTVAAWLRARCSLTPDSPYAAGLAYAGTHPVGENLPVKSRNGTRFVEIRGVAPAEVLVLTNRP